MVLVIYPTGLFGKPTARVLGRSQIQISPILYTSEPSHKETSTYMCAQNICV